MTTTEVSPGGLHPEKAQRAETLPSEAYVEKALPRILNTWDMIAIFLVAIFFISNAATAASGGAVAYVYWILGGITFFIPTVIATAQLGVIFPHEGSIYNWTYKVLGPYWAFFAGLCWWFPSALILVSAADTFVTYLQGLNSAWLTEPWQQGLAISVIVLFSGIAATRRARIVQNVINFGAGSILCAALLIGAAGFLWLATGHQSVTSFTRASDWTVSPETFGLFSLISLAYLGSQVPLNMGGEVIGVGTESGFKKIKRHLFWGSALVIICYFVVTFALLVVQGPMNGATPFALVSTVDKVFGKVAGDITVVCIMSFFICAAIMYNASFARLLFVGGIDQRVSISMGRLNKHRVPANAVMVQTVLAILFAAFAFLLVPYAIRLGGSPADLAVKVYNVSLAVVSIIWGLITVFFYICLWRLYSRDRENFLRKRIFPLPVLVATCILGPIGCVATIAGALLYSWIPSLIPNTVWTFVVGGVVVACFVLVAVGSMFTTSEAAWQNWAG